MTEDPNRNQDGTFTEGNNANPNGTNGIIKGWQPYSRRLSRFVEMSLEELEALIASTEFRKYSAMDRAAAFHAKRIADQAEAEHIAERERANDRIDGRPKQSIKHGGDPDNPSPIAMSGTFTLTFGTDDNDGSSSGVDQT